MTRITKRTLGVSALSVLILMTLSVAGYDHWFSPTRILVVNTRQAPAADITLNNDSRHIRVTCLPTEEVTSFDGYDAVIT